MGDEIRKPGLLARLLLKTVYQSRPMPALTDGAGWAAHLGSHSYSGRSVTSANAMQLATVWACVRLISETIATLPFLLYYRGSGTERRVASDHPLYEILHDQPHYDLTAVEFWEGVVVSILLQGNSYSEMLFAGGRLIGLKPLPGDLVAVSRNSRGARVYRWPDEKNKLRELPEDKVFHVRGFGPSGDLGLSVISFARHSLGAAMATEESAGKVFSNGLQVAGVLSSDQILKPEHRTQLAALLASYIGSSNAQKTLVLEAGLKYQQVSMLPEDAQMLQSRAFNVEEICRWFRVPPSMVGHTVKSTSWGTGIEQQMLGFLTFTLTPYLKRIEQAVRRSLIPVVERDKIFAEFKVEGLLRSDSAARASFYQTMVQNGIMTRNEVRGLENLPAMPKADDLTVQSQNVPLGAPPPAPAIPVPAVEDEEE